MIRWRYATISVRPARDNAVMLVAGETEVAEAPLGALLARAGEDGWEMVGLSSPERGWQVFAFKQPIPEPPAQESIKQQEPPAKAEAPEPAAPQASVPQKPARKPENAQLSAPKRPTRGKKAPR